MYGHYSFLSNGGRYLPYPDEDREIVPSQKVATYDQRPEMSVAGVAGALVRAVRSGRYDFAIVNLANPDMVGHTGDFAATVRAMEATDAAVGEIVDATLDAGGGAPPASPPTDPPRRASSAPAWDTTHTPHP